MQPRGVTPRPRSGAAASLCWSSCEEIPHVQGKTNPSKRVGAQRGHQTADRLKPQPQTTSQSDHMDHSLVWFSETKPCHIGPPKMTGGGEVWQNVVSWRMNGKPLQYSCLEKPMNSMQRQEDRTLKDELPRLVGAQYATGDQWRNNSRKNEGMDLKQKQQCDW